MLQLQIETPFEQSVEMLWSPLPGQCHWMWHVDDLQSMVASEHMLLIALERSFACNCLLVCDCFCLGIWLSGILRFLFSLLQKQRLARFPHKHRHAHSEQPPSSILSLSLCLYEGTLPPTDLLLPYPSRIPLRWGTKPPQDQWPPFSLMTDKAILSYI